MHIPLGLLLCIAAMEVVAPLLYTRRSRFQKTLTSEIHRSNELYIDTSLRMSIIDRNPRARARAQSINTKGTSTGHTAVACIPATAPRHQLSALARCNYPKPTLTKAKSRYICIERETARLLRGLYTCAGESLALLQLCRGREFISWIISRSVCFLLRAMCVGDFWKRGSFLAFCSRR